MAKTPLVKTMNGSKVIPKMAVQASPFLVEPGSSGPHRLRRTAR